MPFSSKAQMKKCFVTKGFGGKVDCKEWAKKTNFSKLPEKVKKHKKNKMFKSFKEWVEENKEN